MQFRSCLLLPLLLAAAAGFSTPSLRAASAVRRIAVPRACAADEAPLDEAAGEGDDNVSCSGRVVTELIDAETGALPDRFMMAVRAIRGEFSPSDEAADTENAEDAITSALINFPAKVRLKIVSTPLGTADEAKALGSDLSLLCKQLEGAGEPELCSVERGSRRSYELIIDVPDAAALAVLRNALLEDERVQMVF